MFFPVADWFAAFVITVALEAPVVLFLLRRAEPNLLRLGVLVVFANLATHPVVWFVMTQLLLIGTPEYVLAAETWAIAAEALFFATAIRGLSVRMAIVTAVAANATSFFVGRLVAGLWPDLIR